MSSTKKSTPSPEVQAAIQAALDQFHEDQTRLLSMSEIGRLLGLNPYQLIRAKKEGRLTTKRLDVATPEAVRQFAEQHLVYDKNGKLRVTTRK